MRGPGDRAGCRWPSRAGSRAWPSGRCSTSTRGTLAARQDLPTYLAVSGTSLPYNLAHAIGNVVFCLLIGPAFIRALRALPAALRGALAPGRRSVAGVLLLAVRAGDRRPAPRPAVEGDQATWSGSRTSDGGFGARQGPALDRAVHRLGGARPGGGAAQPAGRGAQGRPVDHPVHARREVDLTTSASCERTILVLKAAGISPRRYRGRNLVADLLRPPVAATARGGATSRSPRSGCSPCAPGARRGAPAPSRGAPPTWSAGRTRTAASASCRSRSPTWTMTGAALQTLAAAGRGSGTAARKGIAWLRSTRNADGGFGQSEGKPSNSQSTAWAVQGLVAVGRRRRRRADALPRRPPAPRRPHRATRPPATRRRCG